LFSGWEKKSAALGCCSVFCPATAQVLQPHKVLLAGQGLEACRALQLQAFVMRMLLDNIQ
jgi:hypothetical protein